MKVINFPRTIVIAVMVCSLLGLVAPGETAVSAENLPDPIKGRMLKDIGSVPSDRVVRDFAEVEINLDDEITLSSVSALPRAPQTDLEVLGDGESVKVQLPQACVEALVAQGAEVTVLRKFILVEGGAGQGAGEDGGITTLDSCSGDYHYGQSDLNVYIESSYPYWFGSGLDFSSYPPTDVVTCIDVHYEVVNLSWSSIVNVALSDDDYSTYVYTLLSGWSGLDGDIYQTRTGITVFNGESIRQSWWLWASDHYPDGYGYIDYWWIKLYYEEQEEEYCTASGGCSSGVPGSLNIDSVEVGDISNTGTGCTSGGYADYTSMSTIMKRGTSYPITVINGDPYDEDDQCGIWVDWNQDVDFYESGERITVGGGTVVFTGTITPPPDAALGDTRMRIRIRWTGTLNSCGSTTWGEVEDYTITVVPEWWLPGNLIEPNGVDMRDFSVMASQWQQPPGEPSADIAPSSGDGVVDFHDLEALVEDWLEGL